MAPFEYDFPLVDHCKYIYLVLCYSFLTMNKCIGDDTKATAR